MDGNFAFWMIIAGLAAVAVMSLGFALQARAKRRRAAKGAAYERFVAAHQG